MLLYADCAQCAAVASMLNTRMLLSPHNMLLYVCNWNILHIISNGWCKRTCSEVTRAMLGTAATQQPLSSHSPIVRVH